MSEFRITRSGSGNSLKIIGELDVATAPRLAEAVREHAGQVILDLSELTFLDSCGTRTILQLARGQNGNGPVVILDPSPPVARLLEIIGIEAHSGIEVRRITPPVTRRAD